MNSSCIIAEEKEIFYEINSEDEQKQCKHEQQTNRLEETIVKDNQDILIITYSCAKCDIKIVTEWKKIGRFYFRRSLSNETLKNED